MVHTKRDSLIGCLLGIAVGDSIGLCYEGLSRQRQRKLYPEISGHRFFLGKGMISDDTEHACMAAQALMESGGDPKQFSHSLASLLKIWMLGLPAGVGFATLRAVGKLLAGFPPDRSGVFSAGNGPAMRSGIIGVCRGDNPGLLRDLVRRSTRMTHTDPKAEVGALAVALAAHMASCQPDGAVDPPDYARALRQILAEADKSVSFPGNWHAPDHVREFLDLVEKAVSSALKGESTESFAMDLGLYRGVTGYMYHTVPVVLQAWLRYQADFRSGIIEVVRCGGDTDTTAAILGGIIGAGLGKEGIPKEWLEGLWEWPRTVRWMEELGIRLAEASARGTPDKGLSLPFLPLLFRNFLFMLVVLSHGFRRLFPPYGLE